ncbi:INO80 complex subunit D-like [Abrus precatorius]|uniref:KAT8 regulatory NSL complex subunit 2 n=1 Tax=Abrus precatorius TaxID=3816 RepID=A0A8B8M7S2_ABRPR|nr:INO80 complex subunit D-like [Abrus precatorius]
MDESKATCVAPQALARASHLTRPELLRRRLENLKRLSKWYRELYWALIHQLQTLYGHYLCHYALSPFHPITHFDLVLCAFLGCKFKAMPFTSFCHFHILSDSSQKLYKPCNYVIKTAQAGPITCGKPILRSAVPSLCLVHSHKAQKHLTRTFKRIGLNVSSPGKIAPKFHILVAEYVHQIQAKRISELRENKNKILVKEENSS